MAALAIPMGLLGALAGTLQGSPTAGIAAQPVTVLFVVIGALKAWGGSQLLIEERMTGLLAQVMFSPEGTRGILRGEAIREALELAVLTGCAVLGAAIVDYDPRSLDSGRVLNVLVESCLAGVLAGLAWAVAAALSLWADALASFGTTAVAIAFILVLHRRFPHSLDRPDVTWLWFGLSLGITWGLVRILERAAEKDSWRLRNCRR